jgi:glycosyltransferase involved in cell wall biosynthesis
LSVSRQSFSDFEVIVADNDPEASGKKIVESISDTRFRYHCNGSNLGMKASFNKALSLATGEFIVMIADDDPVYPDMLETLVALAEKYPGYGMYMGGCDWYCTTSELSELYKLRVGTNSCLSDRYDIGHVEVYSTEQFLVNLYTLKIFRHFLWSTGMVRRDLLQQMGGIPDYGSPFLGDYAYMSVASAGKGCVIINKSLGRQTIHSENFGRNQNEQLPVVVRNFPEFLDKKLGHLPAWTELRKLMLRFTGIWAVEHMAFLYSYQVKNNKSDINSFISAEKEVFSVDYMKSFRLKYFLKKHFRGLHDLLVRIKAKFS